MRDVESMRPGGLAADWRDYPGDSGDDMIRDAPRQYGNTVLGNPCRTCPCGQEVMHGSPADRQHAGSCGDQPLPASALSTGQQILALHAENRDLRRRLDAAEAQLAAGDGGDPA